MRKEPESCSPLLPCRLRGCIIIPVEPIKLLELIVLQITELRPGGLAGLTSHASSDWSKIPWKNPANEWCILSHLPHVWFLLITKSPIWEKEKKKEKKETVKGTIALTPTLAEKSLF